MSASPWELGRRSPCGWYFFRQRDHKVPSSLGSRGGALGKPPASAPSRCRQTVGVKEGGSQGCITVDLEARRAEFDVDNDAFRAGLAMALQVMGTTNAAMLPKEEVQELELDTDEWLMGICLDDLQGPGSLMLPWDDSYAASFLSSMAAMKMEQNISPFLF
ncbi:hypothetical protein ZWY2020_026688 [Hordeum vulgare]|nr:hypothetical protein ZWY2020_026688 [Hordeum vulgare]